MFGVLLQLGNASPAELVILASDFLVALLGLVVSVIAYQGYRGNESQPMLFVAAGFILVFPIPAVLAVVLLVGSPTWALALAAVTQVSELCGLASILYGLRVPASR